MNNNKKLLVSCFYAFFYSGIVMLTLGSALPDISSAHNLPYSMSGALLSCYSLGNLASGILVGLAAMYLGAKTSIIILTLSICLGYAALTLAGIPALLLVFCAMIGLGRGSLITFSQGTVSLITDGKPQTTLMLHASFAAGAILAPLMFSALRGINWRAGLIFVAVLGGVAVMLFLNVRDYPQAGAPSGKSLAFLREKGFMLMAALIFMYLCCEFALNGWLVTYMTHKNMTMNYSQSMAALMWIVMLAGRLLCVRLSGYMKQSTILLVLSLGACVCFGVMLRSEGKISVAVSVALVGLFMSGISPIIYASSAKYTNKYPLAMGVLFTSGCTGGTLMPLITGIIAEHWGFTAGMSAVLGTFIMLLIFAVMNIWRRNS